MPSRTSIIALVIVGILVISAGVITFFYNKAPLSSGGEGLLSGTVSIGPTSPVCRANATTTSAPPPWSSNQVVVIPASGSSIYVPVNWTLSQGCEISGSFHVPLIVGTYRVDLSSCMSQSTRAFGCAKLPKTVTISANSTTSIEISIDTGIR